MKSTTVLPLCLIIFILGFLFSACEKEGDVRTNFQLENVFVGNQAVDFTTNPSLKNVGLDQSFELIFSTQVDENSVAEGIQIIGSNGSHSMNYTFFNDNKNVKVSPARPYESGTTYELWLTNVLKSSEGVAFLGISPISFTTLPTDLTLLNWEISGQFANEFTYLKDINRQPTIRMNFSAAVNPDELEQRLKIVGKEPPIYTIRYENEQKRVIIEFTETLPALAKYNFSITAGAYGSNGQMGAAFSQVFYTKVNETPVFPTISEEALLTKIQEQTFRYFWNFGHPVSGLTRERSGGDRLVTMGGSGFGLMTMIVGVERGFITRQQAVDRWTTIVDFLAKADRFHGAFPHWMDGSTGEVIPFSQRDDGGDLVETALLMQGLLTVRQYLDANNPSEQVIINQINTLWQEVEWTWYTKGGEKQLYWHWSPNRDFAINLPIRGHNETQIVYILAAASPTFPIDLATYENGYARNGNMQNGSDYYGIELPLGPNFGGPLFFAHYSYLGLDPRNLVDKYANYWEQNRRHAQINQRYCADNPKNYVGYSTDCWGLTASYGNNGYLAHSPNNDVGVIAPTAAVASIPFTPEKSMAAINHFYYQLGDRLWGEFGFYDAFNPTAEWTSDGYLAIDQGPIILMIENYRSQLLWELFMSVPEVEEGLKRLEFISY